MLKKLALILLSSALVVLTACSKEDLSDYQRNAVDPDFTVFTLVEGYPTLEYIWDNMNSDLVNEKLSETMDKYADEFVRFSTIQSNIMRTDPDTLVSVVKKASKALDTMLDTDEAYYYSPYAGNFYNDRGSVYRDNFYGLLERISNAETEGLRPAVMNTLRTILDYIIETKDQKELNQFMYDAIAMMEDLDRDDFIDLTTMLGKMLMSGNYPIHLDGSGELITDPDDINSNSINTDLGNMTKGIVTLLDASAQMVSQDPALKERLFSLLDEVPVLYAAETGNGKDLPHVLKDLVENIETYFLPVDASDTVPADRADYYINNSEIYVNSDLKNTMKEMMPALQKLMIASGKPGAVIRDPEGKGRGFLDIFMQSLKQLGWTDEYIKNMNLDADLVNMVRYDGFGKDRAAGGAEVSYLDHTVFTLLAAANFGYNDSAVEAGVDGEVYIDSGESLNHGHGHGSSNGGMITLNDCLIVQEVPVNGTTGDTTYSLVLGSPKGDQTFRSSTPYSAAEKDQNRFYLHSSYPSNCLLSGQCIGDGGLPNGGKGVDTDNDTIPEAGESDTGNYKWITYWPYNGNGTGEMNTARWSMGWIGRICWNGEGPYYYADPKAEEVQIDGKSFKKYLRPNGHIYAYVYKPDESDPTTWEYIYPKDSSGDAKVKEAEIPFAEPNATIYTTDGAKNFDGKTTIKFTVNIHIDGYSREVGSGSGWNINENSTVAEDIRDQINGDVPDTSSWEEWWDPMPGTVATVVSVNGENQVRIETLSEYIYFNDNYSGTAESSMEKWVDEKAALNDVIFIPKNSYSVTESTEINLKIDDSINENITIPSGISSIDDIINLINSKVPGLAQKKGDTLPDSFKYVGEKDTFNPGNAVSSNTTISSYSPHIVFKTKDDRPYNTITISRVGASGTAMQDVFGLSSESHTITVISSRENRYKEKWETDYYMFGVGGSTYSPLPHGGVGKSGKAGCYVIEEIIPEKPAAGSDVSRECSSQEEAMQKNYQYLMQEKKIVYVIPMTIDTTAVGCELQFAVACRIEANGVTGLMTARKYPGGDINDNGKWILSEAGKESKTIPGNGRIAMDIKMIKGITLGHMGDEHTIYESLGEGPVLPPVVGYNMAPVARMGYILEDINEYNSWQVGADFVNWSKRSKAFPMIVAMMGTLRELTHYETPTDGSRIFNRSDKNRYPAKILTDNLLPALGKPMFYYQKSGQNPTECWKPRIKAADVSDGVNGYLRQVGSSTDFSNYVPRYYKTLTGMLFESDATKADNAGKCDGLVPLMSKSKMGTKSIQLLNGIANGDSLIYDDKENFSLTDMSTWGVRRKLAWAMEQLMTGMKASKGEAYELTYLTDIAEKWQYIDTSKPNNNLRDCDIDMDDMLGDLLWKNWSDDDSDGVIDPGEYEQGLLAELPDATRSVDVDDRERITSIGRVVDTTLANTSIVNADASFKIYIGETDTGATVSNGVITGDVIDGMGLLNPQTGDIYFTLKEEPTEKITVTYEYGNDWQGFFDLFEDLGVFIESDSKYYVYDDVTQIVKSTLNALTYDENLGKELQGALYTLGKLLAHYNGNRWVYQGEEGFDFLYTMLKEDLPKLQKLMVDETGDNINAALLLIRDLAKANGLVDAALDSIDEMNVTDAFEWSEIFGDLGLFLHDPLLNEVDSDLWPTLANMMDDMSDAIVGSSTGDGSADSTGDALKDIYQDFGFQYNGN